jgi:hypothetical protein
MLIDERNEIFSGRLYKTPDTPRKYGRIKTELTNKSSRIDDLNVNAPITLNNST